MVRETGVQFQVESYQRLKKCYLMPPCLTLSIIRYESKVKWSNPENGVAPSRTPWCGSYWTESLRVTLDYGRQLYHNHFTLSRSTELKPYSCTLVSYTGHTRIPGSRKKLDHWSLYIRRLNGHCLLLPVGAYVFAKVSGWAEHCVSCSLQRLLKTRIDHRRV